jgi:hypothetical protein
MPPPKAGPKAGPRMVNEVLTRRPKTLTMIKILLTGSVFFEMPSG